MKIFAKITGSMMFLLSVAFGLSAQSPGLNLSGKVVDGETGEPLPYATVIVASGEDNSPITGASTAEDGSFSLRSKSRNIYLVISFIGYQKDTLRDIATDQDKVDLGTLKLNAEGSTLEEVQIRAERSSVEFKLDKRVFNVGQDLSSTGMGALEVLNNVPSVNVNIEGEVTLRGNSGVQILINGKPSVMADEGSNALGSITADMIESVEVITNPSAKYEAGGTSGILNIVLKKEEKKGLNGSISANTGIPDNHSIGVSLNRRTEKFNFFTQFGAGYRSLPRFNESENRNLETGTSIVSDGTEFRNEYFYNITLGSDYYIDDLNVITLSGNFAYEVERQPSTTQFDLFDQNGILNSSWLRTENTSATNPKYQYDLQYKREFKDNEDHTLLFSTLGSFFGKKLSSQFNNMTVSGSDVSQDQRTETDFFQRDFTFKLDYTNPLTKNITIETGALYEINDVGNDYAVSNLENGMYVVDSGLTNNFEYDQKVLGVYGTGSYESKKWGLKLGLRVENTDLKTLLNTTNQANNQNYTNLFPSVHATYKISALYSLQAGYSRRIRRPRLWDLNPFFNIRNNFNIRQGNPNLLPEFADSYEITSVFIFEKVSLNTSIYHLYTTEVIERVSRFEDNVNVTLPMNIGTNRKTGFELNGKYSAAKWLTFNGDFNYGFFIRRGSFENQNFDFNGDQWSSRLTAKLKLPLDFDLEITGNHQSGFKTVQGVVSGYTFANAGLRKKLWKGKVIANLAVRDIFASRIRESLIEQPDFYLYNFSQRGRFFTAGLSYSFGKGEAMTYSGRRHH